MPNTRAELIDELKVLFCEMLGVLYDDETDLDRAITIANYHDHARMLLYNFLPPQERHHCIFVMMSRVDPEFGIGSHEL